MPTIASACVVVHVIYGGGNYLEGERGGNVYLHGGAKLTLGVPRMGVWIRWTGTVEWNGGIDWTGMEWNGTAR